MNEIQKDSAFLVTNASGRHINLLNDDYYTIQHHVITTPSPPISEDETPATTPSSNQDTKRKYHCAEPGCTKSFTTSGHLARHNRIHTGEKNFPCLFPGCQSKFSRQDNMMQHYRTHMSPKSKRAPKKNIEDDHPRPKLHAHQRIRSDPYILDRPLTIDQHLNNYRQSLYHPPPPDTKYMPSPLIRTNKPSSPPPPTPPPTATVSQPSRVVPENHSDEIKFYQHQPLVFSKNLKIKDFPYTLLHPENDYNPTPSGRLMARDHIVLDKRPPTELPMHPYDKTTSNSSRQSGLSQLAHIISTFS